MSLVLVGPRIFGAFWRIWPFLGIVFLPWTTLMYVIVADNGMTGLGWLWIGLMLIADLASYGGGVGRKQIPGYEGY